MPRSTLPWAPPFLRWAGSKRKLVPRLIELTPPKFERYFEPFAGSACLFFALNPGRAVLGDANHQLITTYTAVREHPRLVARIAAQLEDTESEYYRLRRLSPDDLRPIERAARFIYLNRHCFNGVYRTNLKGEFNVPRGSRTGRLPREKDFYRCSFALRSAELRAADFQDCVKDVGEGDFVYLDPPYATRLRRGVGEYGYGCFGRDDLTRLCECLRKIDRVGGTFLLSYCECPEIADVLPGWYHSTIRVRRHVAGFGQHRNEVSEVIISNRPL
ncbi:MAG: Dam family site-specific DNA-(adenine-N6)-methyltransferase [Candidatus Marsarchaeota archaeon]|nr:Dam family site-specific DNA-(adenine-N6)-methyltransferase [Candidatus Marsarchaeota archaeon]